MAIKNLTKIKANRVIGIDASTNSLAFAIFENGSPIKCGEIMFDGGDLFSRMLDAKHKVRALVNSGVLKADFVSIESAWTGHNPRTGLELAYMYGTIISELLEANPIVHKVAPIQWQSAIGNPLLTNQERAELKKKNPKKSKTWLQTQGREFRKARTMEIARKYFDIPGDSDNVSDAVGVALYTVQTLTTTG